MNIYLIADYGPGDLAYAEVSLKILNFLPDANIITANTEPFNSYQAGLFISQIASVACPGDIIYHNVAPRKDNLSKRENNDGEKLAFAKTDRGVFIFGPESAGSYSFSRDIIESFYYVAGKNDGSQFRSRDVFPERLPPALRGEGLVAADVPGVIQEKIVIGADGYGNIKTNIAKPFQSETAVIEIDGHSATVFGASSAFSVPDGYLSFAPGSSRQGFYEIFLRGGSAAEVFGYPSGGSEIIISETASEKLLFPNLSQTL